MHGYLIGRGVVRKFQTCLCSMVNLTLSTLAPVGGKEILHLAVFLFACLVTVITHLGLHNVVWWLRT